MLIDSSIIPTRPRNLDTAAGRIVHCLGHRATDALVRGVAVPGFEQPRSPARACGYDANDMLEHRVLVQDLLIWYRMMKPMPGWWWREPETDPRLDRK